MVEQGLLRIQRQGDVGGVLALRVGFLQEG